jgi:2'-5' RNA ligase
MKSPLFERSKTAVEYEFSTTQAVYDGATTRDLLGFIHNTIQDEDVYVDESDGIKGRERKPHLTLLYGIKQCKPDIPKLEQLIQNHPALNHVEWLGLSKFEAEKNDVLVILIESEEAQELFSDLMALYPDNANSFPDYQPHTTLAYLKKGMADKYIEKYFDSFVDGPVPIKHLEFENNGDIAVFDPNSAQLKKTITAADLLTRKEAVLEPKTAYQRWLSGD